MSPRKMLSQSFFISFLVLIGDTASASWVDNVVDAVKDTVNTVVDTVKDAAGAVNLSH